MYDIRLISLNLIFSEMNNNSVYEKRLFSGFISKCKSVNIFRKHVGNVIEIAKY